MPLELDNTYRVAGLFRGRKFSREFRGSVPVRENIIREYCMHAPRPLALVPDSGGVADIKTIRENFYSRNTLMPAIRENFLLRNKPAIR